MTLHARIPLLIALSVAGTTFAQAPTKTVAPVVAVTDQNGVQALLDSAVALTLEKFAPQKLQSNQLAVTLVDLRDAGRPAQSSYRGDVPIYPASVVKLFYLVAAHRWMEDGRMADTPELRRALRDMVVESYNEATHYIVDLLTGTTSGPELSEAEIDVWFAKRNAVNHYFWSLGYTNINANKKPWCEGPYGREMQSIKMHQPHRNALTTDATARLLVEIATGRAVSEKRSAEMMALMKRDPFVKPPASNEPDQGHDFIGAALPRGGQIWSKAGWTSQTRHDAACIELPGGARFVLVVFTTDHANDREILPTVARSIMETLAAHRATR